MEITVVQGGAYVVHVPPKGTAGELKRRRKTLAAGRADRGAVGAIETEARAQLAGVESGKAATGSGNDRLRLLSFDSLDIFFRCPVHCARPPTRPPDVQPDAVAARAWLTAH